MESQSSRPSSSTGTVSGRRAWAPGAEPTGIRSAIEAQPGIASATGRWITSAAARPVTASAAGFQRRRIPSRSTRKTPSPT